MIDSLSAPNDSSRHQLPLLAPGQAQKELFLNAALLRIDALLHPSITGTSTTPPAAPAEGESWIVGANAEGSWQGKDDHIASRQGATWQFLRPIDGMRVYQANTGQYVVYRGGWRRAVLPVSPTGGAVIDSECRVAILQLIDALKESGIFPVN